MENQMMGKNKSNGVQDIETNKKNNEERTLIKISNTIVFNGVERKIIKRDDKLNNILIEIPIINNKGNTQIVQQWIKDIEE